MMRINKTPSKINPLWFCVATGIIILIFCLALIQKNATQTNAYLDGFRETNVISDSVMSNKDTMSEADIWNWLHAYGDCNNTHTDIPGYRYHWKDGHHVCMADELIQSDGMPDWNNTGVGETTSHIIWQAAQDYSINPQLIITKLQVEQSLVTDGYPSNIEYRSATGYGCPDSAPCDSEYYGFRNQVRNMAAFFRGHLNNSNSWHWHDYDNHLHAIVDGRHVYTENVATTALYIYTPHDQSRLYNIFTDWFGSTTGFSVKVELISRYNQLGNSGGSLGIPVDSGFCNPGYTVCYQQFKNGYIIYGKDTGAWESKGGIRERWGELKYQNGVLGFPVDAEVYAGNNTWWQQYQNGFIVGSIKTGFWESKGAIRTHWGAIGFQNGKAGWPIGAEKYDSTDGTWSQPYQNGIIYYSDTKGAWFTAK